MGAFDTLRIASSSNSWSGWTSLTSPQRRSTEAGTRWPSIAISAARPAPMRVEISARAPPSGTSPMFTKASSM